MRRILTLALALALAVAVRAEFVRPDVAAKYAQGVLGSRTLPVPERSATQRVAGRDVQEPQYYIFNNPDGGWVIIAADDRVNPIIGYSDEGSFTTDGMPDNIRWWMDGVASTIDAMRDLDQAETLAPRPEWKIARRGSSQDEKVELQTARWDQDTPYNLLCLVATGENVRSVTGCVATAMAIIMRYNRWPEHGKGVIGGYTTETYKTYVVPYSIEDHIYNYDDMPMSNGAKVSWTPEEKNQVAQLMHDCGVSVHMDYTYSKGSAASGIDMLGAMQDYFSYSKSSAFVQRASYRLDEWFQLIKKEIDCGRVVYYGGMTENDGGHAFVCDGYDTQGSMLKINWGWGGSCNGFYTLDLIVTEANFTFNREQEAIIGLAPENVDVEHGKAYTLVFNTNEGLFGIQPDGLVDMTNGSEFRFKVGWMQNNSPQAVLAQFRVRLEDKEGKQRQEGWMLNVNIPGSDGYMYSDYTSNTTLLVTPEPTDHFRLYMKGSSGKWEPVRGNYDLLPDVEGIVCGVLHDPVILVPDGCSAGQEIELSLTLGFTHVKSVRWSVNGTELTGNTVQLVKGRNDIRATLKYLDGTTGSVFRTLIIE